MLITLRLAGDLLGWIAGTLATLATPGLTLTPGGQSGEKKYFYLMFFDFGL